MSGNFAAEKNTKYQWNMGRGNTYNNIFGANPYMYLFYIIFNYFYQYISLQKKKTINNFSNVIYI